MPRDGNRSKYEHWLIRSSTDVLRDDFVEKYCRGDPIDMSSALPFSGPLMLPTRGEALKLWWFFKDNDGRKNTRSLSTGQINSMVLKVISHYWRMAGFETDDDKWRLSDGRKHTLLSLLVKSYQKLLKSRSSNTDDAKKKREEFLADMKTCLNFGVSDLRDKLLSDRVRSNLGLVMEDVSFLDDQFGQRKGWSMSSKMDEQFAARREANRKRKLLPAPKQLPVTMPDLQPHGDDVDEQVSDEDKENRDKDFTVATKSRKKEDRITVSVPRNLVSPALVGSLDRTKTSSYSAMRNLAAVVSTFQTEDGRKVGIDNFTLSRSSIDRGRLSGRQLISDQAKLEFLRNLPDHLTAHWDGKMIEDILGILNEAEAIVTCGGEGKYKEGKVLDIVDLKDSEGKKTSTGEAQAKAVYASLLEWGADVIDRIRGFVFDTTASNTGWRSGATVRLNYMLDRAVLYLACRHHVMELMAKNPFHAVVGYDPSPDVAMFKRFKEIFPLIDTTGSFETFQLESDQKEELIKTYTEILTKQGDDGKLFVRQDYRELCQIALVMVGGLLPGGEIFLWPPPGACHKARFMAFALMVFKILAFSHLKEVKNR